MGATDVVNGVYEESAVLPTGSTGEVELMALQDIGLAKQRKSAHHANVALEVILILAEGSGCEFNSRL